MNLPKVPTPTEALNLLSQILPELQAGFETGVFEARDYFAAKQVALDRSALSMMIRLHVKDRLLKAGMKEVIVENNSLCGLAFRFNDCHVRIWKSEDDHLPDPGSSKRKQAFYQYSLEFGDERPYQKFAVIWNLNVADHFSLWLVCPKYFDSATRITEVHWRVPIPDAVFGIKARPTAGRTSDLPIKRKIETTKVKKA